MTRLRYLAALGAGLRDAMTVDPSVFVLGEDIRHGIRGITTGLAAEFGDHRVIDTPLSEQGFTGFATGAAMTGYRPVVEYQIPALLYIAFEQLVNQASKLHLMTGGQVNVPVTYIVPGSGARMGLAGQHSDHPYSLFSQMGMKTVIPSTPQLAYDCVRIAIEDDDPVILFSPAAVQSVRGEVDTSVRAVRYRGHTHRTGTDVTVVATGHLVHEALAFAEADDCPCSIEVFDPVWIYPLDRESLRESIARTGRLVVIDDSNRSCGFASEVLATASESGLLRTPPVRVTRPDMTAMPFAVGLETALVPGRDRLAAAVRQVLS